MWHHSGLSLLITRQAVLRVKREGGGGGQKASPACRNSEYQNRSESFSAEEKGKYLSFYLQKRETEWIAPLHCVSWKQVNHS